MKAHVLAHQLFIFQDSDLTVPIPGLLEYWGGSECVAESEAFTDMDVHTQNLT